MKPFHLPSELVKQIKFISPNIYELDAIADHLNLPKIIDSTETSIDHLFESDSDLLLKIKAATTEITKHIENVICNIKYYKYFKKCIKFFVVFLKYISL